jgi:putative ABC transport system permease protein
MFSVRDAVFWVSVGLGIATLATAVLVFALSIRMRRREIETVRKIGAPRSRLIAILSTEVLMVVIASVAIAGALTAVVSRFGGVVLQLVTS